MPTLRPTGSRLIIERYTPAQISEAGIHIPKEAQEIPMIATVMEVGPDVSIVKPDDKVICSKYIGTVVEFDHKEHTIIDEVDILIIIED